MAKKCKTFRLSEEDIAFIQKQKPDGSLTEALEILLQNLKELEDKFFILREDHPEAIPKDEQAPNCFYHAYDPKRDQWYCDVKPIPKVVCLRRHARYVAMNRKCLPAQLKRKPFQKTQQQQKTRVFRDEFEQAYYPDSESHYRDDWGQQT